MCVKTKYSDMQAKHTHTHLFFYLFTHTYVVFGLDVIGSCSSLQ